MAVDLDSMARVTRLCIERTLDAYMDCALWASVGDDGEPMSGYASIHDIHPEARERMLEEVHAFLSACWGDTWEDFHIDLSDIEPEQIGHDLWLTRNRHGAGFWDRGLGDLGDRLTTLAHSMGMADLYLGDDNLIHQL